MTDGTLSVLLHLLWDMGLGIGATLGFAVWFQVPRRALGRVVLVGMAGFLVRELARDFLSMPFAFATFWAALTVGIAGLLVAKTVKLPRVVFTVTGIIPLVPGAPAHDSMVRFSAGNIAGGAESLITALLVTLAIAAGLTGARAIQFWR